MNEKLLETLFNRFAMQCFRLGEAWVHTPSSREEFVNGYDSKIVRMGSVHEIIVQFKKPHLTRSGFTIRTTPHQHEALLRLYPPGTAYYVSATFRDFTEVQEAQRQVKKATDFLKYYIAVEIQDTLPSDVTFIQYERHDESWAGRNVRFKCMSDGSSKKAAHAVSSRGGWESGSTLIRKFKQRTAGSVVRLLGADTIGESEAAKQVNCDAYSRETWQPSRGELNRAAVGLGVTDLPTALRLV